MKKCLIIPDSFKGTLSSQEICEIIQKSVKKQFPNCEAIAIPVADGGEGTVDSFISSIHAKKIDVTTTNPYNKPIKTYYAIKDKTAIIEMACCAGLPLVGDEKNPLKTTTFGVGTIILDAIKHNCHTIILGLGGSCTNDGGVGMAAALGTKFYHDSEEINPSADKLTLINKIDNSLTIKTLKNIKIIAMCDVTNPLCGHNGASYIFAPQKGADPQQVILLEQNICHLEKVIKQSLQIDVSNLVGGGAAGGLGAGVVAFLNGKLQSGIDTILDIIKFEDLLIGTDIIFTGEGKIDSQSLGGKVISGIALRAKRKNIPVIAICGSIGDVDNCIYDIGVNAIFSINTTPLEFSKSQFLSKENLEITMKNLLRFYQIAKNK